MDRNRNNGRHEVCNVLVIGTGSAGLRAAIAAHDAGVAVVVVGKRARTDAHTVLASGGINAALGTVDPEDDWQQHFVDTLREAYFLADPRAVEMLVREASDAIHELDHWGCDFARTQDGKIDQRYFGAHKYRRTCYVGDFTGRSIIETLDHEVSERAIRVKQHQYISRLLVHDGRCFGALAFDLTTGERTAYFADAVVLATGGYTRLWRRSTSRRDENTGDGVYLGLAAGCRVADMEFVQFHPTGMVTPEELAGTLVTEAVRGEGGRLYNAEGERFMERYDPDRMELSTRDRVALANYTEIAEGRGGPHGGVFLDLTHKSKDEIIRQLPRIHRQFLEYQMIDISSERVEVAPTAHYSMGGLIVDPDTHATEVEGLYAAGEVTSGVHGANRLGGNSLTETLVFGRRVGEAAAGFSQGADVQLRRRATVAEAHAELDSFIKEGSEFARPLQRALRNAMWEGCGVVRDENGLNRALDATTDIRSRLDDVDVHPSAEGYGDLAHALDLRASLRVAEATILAALERRESRGAHNRSDHPDTDADMRVNLVLRMDRDGRFSIEHRPVPPVRDQLRSRVEEEVGKMDVAGRLLE